MPGAISCMRAHSTTASWTGSARLDCRALGHYLRRAAVWRLAPRRRWRTADHLAQLVERALESLHQRPRVAHQVAVADKPEVDVVAVAHHGHVQPHAVGHHAHREVRL